MSQMPDSLVIPTQSIAKEPVKSARDFVRQQLLEIDQVLIEDENRSLLEFLGTLKPPLFLKSVICDILRFEYSDEELRVFLEVIGDGNQCVSVDKVEALLEAVEEAKQELAKNELPEIPQSIPHSPEKEIPEDFESFDEVEEHIQPEDHSVPAIPEEIPMSPSVKENIEPSREILKNDFLPILLNPLTFESEPISQLYHFANYQIAAEDDACLPCCIRPDRSSIVMDDHFYRKKYAMAKKIATSSVSNLFSHFEITRLSPSSGELKKLVFSWVTSANPVPGLTYWDIDIPGTRDPVHVINERLALALPRSFQKTVKGLKIELTGGGNSASLVIPIDHLIYLHGDRELKLSVSEDSLTNKLYVKFLPAIPELVMNELYLLPPIPTILDTQYLSLINRIRLSAITDSKVAFKLAKALSQHAMKSYKRRYIFYTQVAELTHLSRKNSSKLSFTSQTVTEAVIFTACKRAEFLVHLKNPFQYQKLPKTVNFTAAPPAHAGARYNAGGVNTTGQNSLQFALKVLSCNPEFTEEEEQG
jgi:hypothetical protein